ncbi:MAG: PaaI family thioesterase [Limisphaerales bacterium]
MEPVKQCLAKDQFATHCGIELVSVEPGRARARMTVQAQHLNGIGIAQGGAIFTLADFAFAAASNSHGTVAVAVNVSISFIKAVPACTLFAEALELARSARLGSYTVEVRDEADELIAVFQGMVYRKKESLPGC